MSSIMGVLLIEYVHNGLYNERINFGNPGLIFQVKVIKLGTDVGFNMLLNISSRFYHNHKRIFQWMFYLFLNCAH